MKQGRPKKPLDLKSIKEVITLRSQGKTLSTVAMLTGLSETLVLKREREARRLMLKVEL